MKKHLPFLCIAVFILSTISTAWDATTYTNHYNIPKYGKGDANWDATQRTQMDTIDGAIHSEKGIAENLVAAEEAERISEDNILYGQLLSKYGDLVARMGSFPAVEVVTGTYNGPTGVTITLPRSVSAITEYAVAIENTNVDATVGDVWIAQGTTNFIVYCCEGNYSSTFKAIIFYRSDLNAYGTSTHRTWYVSPLDSITNHADNTTSGSMHWVFDQIAGYYSDVVLEGNHIYRIDDNLTIPAGINLIRQEGATMSVTPGHRLTFSSGSHFQSPHSRAFESGNDTVTFAAGFPVIVGDWFGSDLYKAARSATSQSLITYFSDQTVSSTVLLDRADLSVDGGNGKAYVVTPSSAAFTGSMIIMGNVNTLASARSTIKNMNLDGRVNQTGAKIADNAIKVVQAIDNTIENVSIARTNSHGIYIDADNDPAISSPRIILDINHTSIGSVGGNCLKYYNARNVNVSNGLSMEHVWCNGSALDGYNFVSLSHPGYNYPSVGVHMKDVNFQCGGNGTNYFGGLNPFHFQGQIHVDWDGGQVEGAPACAGWTDNSTTGVGAIVLSGDGTYNTHFPDLIAKRVYFSVLPYVDYRADATFIDCDLSSTGHGKGQTMRLGKRTDATTALPPNQPTTKATFNYPYSTGSKWTDGYNRTWTCDHGSDNVTSSGPPYYVGVGSSMGWSTLDIPIIVPFTYAGISSQAMNIWYPTEQFEITELIIKLYDNWDCTPDSTTVNFGTLDNIDYWLTAGNETITNARAQRSVSSRFDTNSSLYDGSRSMTTMRNSTPYPNLTASGLYNYISLYLSGTGTCSAGSGFAMIYGTYWSQVAAGSEP